MGQSTDALIAYGLSFDEDSEFPWYGCDLDGGGEDFEEWWRDVNGFKHAVEQPDWEAIEERSKQRPMGRPGESSPEDQAHIDAWFGERNDWDKANPLPVELISHCSAKYPMYILAVPGTKQIAHRGCPVEIDLAVGAKVGNSTLLWFCDEHDIKTPEEGPKWWLFSDWS